MNILGISGQECDAAAGLVQDGRVVAAIEEEKLSRIRHIGINYAGGLPERAIRFCLDRAGIDYKDLDYIAYYLEPQRLFNRQVSFQSALATARMDASLDPFTDSFVDSLNSMKLRLRTGELAESRLSEKGRFVLVNHQMAHAASAYYVSGFDTAAILIAANRGDMTSTALMKGEGASITTLAEAAFPNSIGLVYNAVTRALGFGDDWHKTTWLSVTGEPRLKELFAGILSLDRDGLPVVDLDYFDVGRKSEPAVSAYFYERTGMRPRGEGPVTRQHRDLAASLQAHVEDVLCDVASRLRERTGESRLCIAGGVALNSLANAALERRAGFERVFIQPAAGNAGCSVGAALHVWHHLLGNSERGYEMHHAFLGPKYGEEEIKRVLDNCKLAFKYCQADSRLVDEVAGLLVEGNIVAWFQGPMEFGPRTLGARSILASPTSEMMRDNLNTYIKHREDFRPFSAAIQEDRVGEFFEPSALYSFLQSVSKVRPEKRDLIPAAMFGDDLVRVHSVNRKTTPQLWRLLERFGEITGVPVLLNTSFNLFGEPVVSTPREAVRGFYCSGIDALAIGNFLVRK